MIEPAGPPRDLDALADIALLTLGQHPRCPVPTSELLGGGAEPISNLEFSQILRSPEGASLRVAMVSAPATLRHWRGARYRPDSCVIETVPVGSPFNLAAEAGLTARPAWAMHPIRLGPDGQTIRYDLSRPLAALSEAERHRLSRRGAALRPALRRLSATPRIARAPVIEALRYVGTDPQARVLVLGQAAEGEVTTNPGCLTDIDVLRHVLRQYPNAQILYRPNDEVGHDGKAEAALSPRIHRVNPGRDVTDLAPLVRAIHTIDSPLAVLLLPFDTEIVLHGTPAIAGLGVTTDLAPEAQTDAPAVGRDLFLGWYAENCLRMVDIVTGTAIGVEDFINRFAPRLGALDEEMATDMARLIVALRTESRAALGLAHVLDRHGRSDLHLDALRRRLELEGADASRQLIVAAALAQASAGDWEGALTALCNARGHGAFEEHDADFRAALLGVRRRLPDLAARDAFPHRLLALLIPFHDLDILSLAVGFLNARFFNTALVLVSHAQPSDAVSDTAIQALIGAGETRLARKFLDRLIAWQGDTGRNRLLRRKLKQRSGDWQGNLDILIEIGRTSPLDPQLRIEMGNSLIETGQLVEAEIAYRGALRGHTMKLARRKLANLMVARNRIPAAMGWIGPALDEVPQDPALWQVKADGHSYLNEFAAGCDGLLQAVRLSPMNVNAFNQLLELEAAHNAESGDGPIWSSAFRAFVHEAEDVSAELLLARARMALLDMDFPAALEQCREAIRLFPDNVQAHMWYAHALSWQPGSERETARAEIRRHFEIALAREVDDSAWVLLEALRSSAHSGDLEFLAQLNDRNLERMRGPELNRMFVPRYCAALAIGDFLEAYECMRVFMRTQVMRRHRGKINLIGELSDADPQQDNLLVSEGGVGDEIRYATLYPELAARLPRARITVDARLLTLFQRSFPQVAAFVPVTRLDRKRLNLEHSHDLAGLPERALAPYLTGPIWPSACAADAVLPVMCTLADLRRTETDFEPGRDVKLRPDPERVAYWAERLAPWRGRLLVGLTWSSMQRHYQRVEQYLDLDEMAGILALEGVTFVNCQYEDISDQLDELRCRLGVEILDFPDLDKRDDFESLGALLANLDLFIGTGTATTEFAAMMDCPTIHASPANMNAYRNPTGTQIDRYYRNVRLIRPIPASDRDAMMSAIVDLVRHCERLKASGGDIAAFIASQERP